MEKWATSSYNLCLQGLLRPSDIYTISTQLFSAAVHTSLWGPVEQIHGGQLRNLMAHG